MPKECSQQCAVPFNSVRNPFCGAKCESVCSGGLDRLGREIDSGHLVASAGNLLGEQPALASGVRIFERPSSCLRFAVGTRLKKGNLSGITKKRIVLTSPPSSSHNACTRARSTSL